MPGQITSWAFIEASDIYLEHHSLYWAFVIVLSELSIPFLSAILTLIVWKLYYESIFVFVLVVIIIIIITILIIVFVAIILIIIIIIVIIIIIIKIIIFIILIRATIQMIQINNFLIFENASSYSCKDFLFDYFFKKLFSSLNGFNKKSHLHYSNNALMFTFFVIK